MPMISEKAIGEVGIVGVPFSKGQPRTGTENGPHLLRNGGLTKRLTKLGVHVEDHGDIDVDVIENDVFHNVKCPRTVAAASKRTAEKVANALHKNGHCLALGGDHSMAIGTILGHAQYDPNVCVLWVDAHADINTPLTSDSGNIHGMPLSFLVRELEPYVPKLPGFEDIKPCLSAKDIAWIGLRDVDVGEKKIIDKFGMTAYSMQEVDRYGIKEVLERSIKAIDPEGKKQIHLSFDVDAMDPMLTPSTGTPVPGGLSLRETFYIAEEMANTGRLAMLDIAEVNPALGSDTDVQKTVNTTLDVIERFYGNRRQGIYPTGYEIPVAESVKVESR